MDFLVELLTFFDIDNGIIGRLANEELFAIGGKERVVNVINDGFFLTLFQIVINERRLLLAGSGARKAAVDEFAGDCGNVRIISRFGGQDDGSTLEICEVDLDPFGRFRVGPGF